MFSFKQISLGMYDMLKQKTSNISVGLFPLSFIGNSYVGKLYSGYCTWGEEALAIVIVLC